MTPKSRPSAVKDAMWVALAERHLFRVSASSVGVLFCSLLMIMGQSRTFIAKSAGLSHDQQQEPDTSTQASHQLRAGRRVLHKMPLSTAALHKVQQSPTLRAWGCFS
jgi:hypothetical protein